MRPSSTTRVARGDNQMPLGRSGATWSKRGGARVDNPQRRGRCLVGPARGMDDPMATRPRRRRASGEGDRTATSRRRGPPIPAEPCGSRPVGPGRWTKSSPTARCTSRGGAGRAGCRWPRPPRRPGAPTASSGSGCNSRRRTTWPPSRATSTCRPLAVEDAVKAHQRPKLEIYDDIVFMVLKPVSYVDHEEVVKISEIAVFLGPTFVVTVRHGDSDVLRRVRAELDAGGPEAAEPRPDVGAVPGRRPGGRRLRGGDRVHQRRRRRDRVAGLLRRGRGRPLGAHLQAQAGGGRVPAGGAAARGAAGEAGGGPRAGVDTAASTYFRDVHDHVLRASEAIEGHDRLLSDVLQADLVAAREPDRACSRTRSPSSRTRTCARSRPGRPSRSSRRRWPGSTG